MARSARPQAVLDALPLARGMRVLEVGAGPGALAREIATRGRRRRRRHPEAGARALDRIRALAHAGRLLVDDGDPLHEVPLR